MMMTPDIQPLRHRGFTLVELMIVILITAILASVAMAGYSSQIRKSRRTEAKTALLDLAGREEQLFSTTNVYSDSATDLGYSSVTSVGSGYYKVTLADCDPTKCPVWTFTLTATPLGEQAKDLQCQSFVVDSTGARTAVDNGNKDSTATCWK
jgi:type IV pilus assembly protein PilE